MSKSAKKAPSPAERPDLYDGYDGPGDRVETEEDRKYWDGVAKSAIPDYEERVAAAKKARAEREKAA